MASGIYEIRNVKNGRVYIGSTIDFDQRWAQHRQDLSKGIHHSVKLQRAWKKYGAEAFKFAILEHVHNREMLFKIEQMWLNAENCAQNGYNVASMAGHPGTADDCRRQDPSALASAKGKNLSREAQFQNEDSKKRILGELIGKVQSKAAARKWPINVKLKRVARIAFDHWVCGGCSVCHGVASFQWADDDRIQHQLNCDACSGTGVEPINCNGHEKDYVLDTIAALDTLYRETFKSVDQDCIA